MKFHWQISAGEFFELLRPAALVCSAVLSALVLASARRCGYRLIYSLAWAGATFLVPFIALPLYLIARFWSKRESKTQTLEEDHAHPSPRVRFRIALPIVYCLLLLLLSGYYLFREYHTVDAYLARAEQAKVMNNGPKAIREYRGALALEDNPHTHKLLGIELAQARAWPEAWREFQAAEQGGEPDPLLSFRLAQAFDLTGQRDGALREYEKFVESESCRRAPPHEWCDVAKQQVAKMLNTSLPQP